MSGGWKKRSDSVENQPILHESRSLMMPVQSSNRRNDVVPEDDDDEILFDEDIMDLIRAELERFISERPTDERSISGEDNFHQNPLYEVHRADHTTANNNYRRTDELTDIVSPAPADDDDLEMIRNYEASIVDDLIPAPPAPPAPRSHNQFKPQANGVVRERSDIDHNRLFASSSGISLPGAGPGPSSSPNRSASLL